MCCGVSIATESVLALGLAVKTPKIKLSFHIIANGQVTRKDQNWLIDLTPTKTLKLVVSGILYIMSCEEYKPIKSLHT